jgi:hypothetical protein
MCWNKQAQERPSFSDLRSKFDAMLLEDKKDEYISLHDIDQSKLYYQKLFSDEGVNTRSCIESDSSMSSPITGHKVTMKEYLSRSATELDHSQFRTWSIYIIIASYGLL